MDAREVAARWGLEPHPEGGWFRETYRSAHSIAPPGWPGERSLATSILYLLDAGQRSAWHRVRGDELWLWQGGEAMARWVEDRKWLVGPDRARGHELQVLVDAGRWQRAQAAGPGWSLVACLVAPGFDFADFELRGD